MVPDFLSAPPKTAQRRCQRPAGERGWPQAFFRGQASGRVFPSKGSGACSIVHGAASGPKRRRIDVHGSRGPRSNGGQTAGAAGRPFDSDATSQAFHREKLRLSVPPSRKQTFAGVSGQGPTGTMIWGLARALGWRFRKFGAVRFRGAGAFESGFQKTVLVRSMRYGVVCAGVRT